mmetsp:Transcript_69892/g.198369  ORF Transcript_69892/g.198369 Transcript_69892/m.198369 type:complete len:312 (+) Transcript_69892:81-1016(+)
MQPSAQAFLFLLLCCTAQTASSLSPATQESWPWSKRNTPAPAPAEKAPEPAPAERTEPAQIESELAPEQAEPAPEKAEPATQEAALAAEVAPEASSEAGAEKAEPAAEKTSEEAPDSAEASDAGSTKLQEPRRPGCYMRMNSGCPNNPMDTAQWRRDTYAEKRGFGKERCDKRKSTWNNYCGSEDAQMVYVAGEARSEPLSALQISASSQWPWSRSKKAAEEKPAETMAPAAERATLAADKESAVKSPTRPGCYMRMPSGCPKKPMETQRWRHDVWAEKHSLDEAGCQKRAAMWNGFCESQDAMMAFVPSE